MIWRRLHPEKTLNVIFDCPEERVLYFFRLFEAFKIGDSVIRWRMRIKTKPLCPAVAFECGLPQVERKESSEAYLS
jgi:hypothetical protein